MTQLYLALFTMAAVCPVLGLRIEPNFGHVLRSPSRDDTLDPHQGNQDQLPGRATASFAASVDSLNAAIESLHSALEPTMTAEDERFVGDRSQRVFEQATNLETAAAPAPTPAKGPTPGTQKTEQCLACEGAVTAWREQFGCDGLTEPDWTPESVLEMPACPWVTKCSFFVDAKASACSNLKTEFTNDFAGTYKAVEKQRNIQSDRSANPSGDEDSNPAQVLANNNQMYFFEACVELGKCQPSEKDCRDMLLGDTCRDSPSCPDADTCEVNCFMCYWLLKGWFPMFHHVNQEKPEDDGFGTCAGLPEAPPPAETSLIQLSMSMAETPSKGVGSPDLPMDRATPPNFVECINIWEDIAGDPKARFFTSYLTQLGPYDWNANTVCRCLQMCPYDSYEALELMRACVYESYAPLTASLFPDLFDDA